jgi:hypothetical protein
MKARMAAVVMVLFWLAACARPGTVVRTEASPAPAPTSSSASGCHSTGLAVSTGVVDAAMGLRAMPIYLVNCGAEPVTVEGYPVLRALDGDQRALEVEVLNGTDPIAHLEKLDVTPQRVTAAPGERFAAVVVWRNTVADITPPVTARYLDVALAPGHPAQRVRPDGGLDLGTTGRLAVSPWARA